MFLHSFESIVPKESIDQNSSLDWLAKLHTYSSLADPSNFEAEFSRNRRMLEKFGCSSHVIARRAFEFADVIKKECFSDGNHPMLSEDIGKKADAYLERSREVMNRFYCDDSNVTSPDHLLHVTCTGYVSPSSAQRLVAEKNMSCTVTHLYHMGCYASMPAVRTARALCQSQGESVNVDVVHNEMCSLHLSVSRNAPENLVVQSLFADGHIRYRCSNQKPRTPSYKILAVEELVVPKSHEAMTWIPSPSGMHMTLSRDVPDLIAGSVREFIERLAVQSSVELPELIQDSIFALHPGGPKIIDRVAELCELREDQIKFSRAVLRERGNMSSATLPHVWEKIIRSSCVSNELKGKKVVSLAFGPGLTIFGSVFEIQ